MITLESPRLRLRPWRSEDFEAFADFYRDKELSRYVGGPLGRDGAWRRMACLVGHWVLRGCGQWAVEEKETGKFVGSVGLWRPEGWPELELCYWLVRDAQGKGYATEAAEESRRYAFEGFKTVSLVSYIHPDNEASKRVAERLGARFEGVIELLSHGPHCVYRYAAGFNQEG